MVSSGSSLTYATCVSFALPVTYKENRELRTNSLLKILDNPEEPAIIEWHPTKPLIACTSLDTGSIQIFGIEAAQKCKDPP